MERGAPKDLGELKGRLSIEAVIVEHLVPAFAGYSGAGITGEPVGLTGPPARASGIKGKRLVGCQPHQEMRCFICEEAKRWV